MQEQAAASRNGGAPFPPVILIHMGSPEDGEKFLAKRWPKVPAISDPDKTLFHAFDLRRGSLGQLLGPRVFKAAFKSFAKGHFIGAPKSDTLMLSGWFLIDPAGGKPNIAWSHAHADIGDARQTEAAREHFVALRPGSA